MQRYGIVWHEAEGQEKWLYLELIVVDNNNNHSSSSLLRQRVKCAAKHIDTKLYVVKE
jgi:hypothetical protein